MRTYYLTKSTRKNKKYMVKSEGNPTIHFGQFGASDYTIHKDEDRKKRYIIRHKKNEDFKNLGTAGSWSYNLLWTEPSLNQAIKSMERRFSIRINCLNSILL